MDALHRATCLRVFDEPSRVTARDAKRIDRGLEIKLLHDRTGDGRTERSDTDWRMMPLLNKMR